MASAPGRRVFRTPSSLIVSIASAVVAVFLLGDAVLRAGVVTGLLLAPWVLLVLWAVYVVAFVSNVQTDAGGIRVQNLLRIIDMPWQQVSDIQMRWQLLVFLHAGGVVRSFGGPAGRPARPPRRGEAARAAPSSTDREVGWIHDQWEAALRDGGGQGEVRRRWDVWALVALGALIVWAVVALLITGGPS